MYCPIKGRHKPRGSQYYPVLLLPTQYHVDGCDHPDIDPMSITPGTSEQYVTKLKYLMSSQTKAQYEKRRLDTGIVSPSFLLGLQPRLILGIPECFSSEIMHFAGVNMASLFVDLWRGTMNCDELTDSRDSCHIHARSSDSVRTRSRPNPDPYRVPPSDFASDLYCSPYRTSVLTASFRSYALSPFS